MKLTNVLLLIIVAILTAPCWIAVGSVGCVGAVATADRASETWDRQAAELEAAAAEREAAEAEGGE